MKPRIASAPLASRKHNHRSQLYLTNHPIIPQDAAAH